LISKFNASWHATVVIAPPSPHFAAAAATTHCRHRTNLTTQSGFLPESHQKQAQRPTNPAPALRRSQEQFLLRTAQHSTARQALLPHCRHICCYGYHRTP
jgi:hypothetical protein